MNVTMLWGCTSLLFEGDILFFDIMIWEIVSWIMPHEVMLEGFFFYGVMENNPIAKQVDGPRDIEF